MTNIRNTIYLTANLRFVKLFYKKAGIQSFELVDKCLEQHERQLMDTIPFDEWFDEACRLASADRSSWKQAPGSQSLISILETIGLSNATIESKKNWKYVPMVPLELTKSMFAKDKPLGDITELWECFHKEFKNLNLNEPLSMAENIQSLLFKYASTIPAYNIKLEDVSLYDQAKTVSAILICLYDAHVAQTHDNPFLLVGADFSGIQSYIYQIVSKYAGKNLKGRSFYLRLLSDTIVRYLLKELQLFRANIVYNSGGGFFLLAPNSEEVKSKLKNAIQVIEQNLLQTHGTALFVALDAVEMSKNDLFGENIGKKWNELFLKRDRKKASKFAHEIEDNYHCFFEPQMQGGDAARDEITGEEFLSDEKPEKEGELKRLKRTTKEQIKLGSVLKNTDAMIISTNELKFLDADLSVNPISLGFNYYFVSEKTVIRNLSKLNEYGDKVSIITFNEDISGVPEIQPKSLKNIYHLEFYGGNELHERGITFEKMCDSNSSSDDETFRRLGVLRMDVDNLGNIFSKGICPERASLSRYAALSRSFDFFFSGYLNTIWREIAPDQSSIIYSGGDDVFIVGSWEQTISLAETIRRDFREYTCGNKAFSVSGGIAIIRPKFPIMKGAEESDVEEKRAKNHSYTKDGQDYSKNSISFLCTPLNWDEEFPVVQNLKNRIVSLISSNLLEKSFISKVLTHAENAKIENHKIKNMRTYWLITYDLGRMSERKNQDAKVFVNLCKTEVCRNSGVLMEKTIKSAYHPLELWALACRWAELEYRINKI